MASACVIRIGTGGGPDETEGQGSDSAGGNAGGSGGIGGGGGAPVAELSETEWEQFVADHSAEVQYQTAVANYAASATAALVEAQVGDPAALDSETLEAMIAEYAPQGIQIAEEWAAAIGAEELVKGVVIAFECQDAPWNCPQKQYCIGLNAGDGATCYLSGCGKGECPYCPSWFANLVYKHYCVYGCIRPGPGAEVVGGAFLIRTIFNNWNGPHCIGK